MIDVAGMTVLEDFEVSRAEAFFRRVGARYQPRPVATALITHLLAGRPAFLRSVNRVAEVAVVLPKPKTIDAGALREITGLMPVEELNRAAFTDPEHVLAVLERRAAGRDVVLLDVGGYFAPTLEHVCSRFSGQIAGVVEDTENGHQRYEGIGKLPCPVFSVARSPLKDPEDYLVGQSVTFSAEALIRSRGDILQGRPAAVIGFGKLGRSIAAMLHARHVGVTVYDSDPVQRTQALSQGFRTAPTPAQAITGAGLIVCATGNLALREDDFAQVANGAYIASVTSSDDEMELEGLDALYTRTPSGPHVTRYARTGHYFYLLADGNAVNFLHGASVGAFIFLVQAEILAALGTLAAADTFEAGLQELNATERSMIATAWLRYFDGTP